jgi:hypothetical protein
MGDPPDLDYAGSVALQYAQINARYSGTVVQKLKLIIPVETL